MAQTESELSLLGSFFPCVEIRRPTSCSAGLSRVEFYSITLSPGPENARSGVSFLWTDNPCVRSF